MPIESTGERLIPERAEAHAYWEHVYRYRFALPFARGRAVLDLACGEGYGTAALAAVAASAVGVDVSAEAVGHARDRYRVDARVGAAEAVPLPDGSVDVVVSFETIEHLEDPARLVRECHRVLAPGGVLVVSTPNRDVYSSGGHHNPYHHSEMTEAGFAAVLRPWFVPEGWYGQCPTAGSLRPRDLFADGSPLVATRIGRGVRRVIQRWCSPGFRYPPRETDRHDPVGAILRQDRAGAGWVNRFVVRPRAFGHPDRPAYLVAVGRRGDHPEVRPA